MFDVYEIVSAIIFKSKILHKNLKFPVGKVDFGSDFHSRSKPKLFSKVDVFLTGNFGVHFRIFLLSKVNQSNEI